MAIPGTEAAPGSDADEVLVGRYGRRRAAELLGRPAVPGSPATAAGRAPRTARPGTGRPRRYRPGAVVGAVVGLAVVLGWVTWASQGQETVSVSSQLISVETPTVDSIAVVFSAAGPTETPLSCVLDATDREGTVVGRAVVRLPAAVPTARRVRATVATVAPAVDVTLDGCRSPGQTGLH